MELVNAILICYAIYLIFQGIIWVSWIYKFPELEISNAIKHVDSSLLVSIIVPARNEEKCIKNCLDSLKIQKYPNLEIIVVDDESTDRTPDIVTTYGSKVRLINNLRLPHNWVGKSWACYNGALAAKGSWLLFIDADALYPPYSISTAINYAVRMNIDMLTIWPLMRMENFWEKLILPIVFRYFFVDFKGKKINDPNSKKWAAFGMFILIRSDVYRTIGGHSAIKSYTDEDYRIAELVKKKNFHLCVLKGKGIVEKRMYDNFFAIWNGWVKNSFAGFDYNIYACLLAILGFAINSVFPAILLFALVSLSLMNIVVESSLLILCIILYLIVVLREATIRGIMGYKKWPAFLTFLGESLFIGINIHSAILTLCGRGVYWKGRSYSDVPKF